MGIDLIAAALSALAAAAAPCAAPLPPAPAVPAPIVFRTSCGAFRVDPGGGVHRLARGWIAQHAGGTGRRFGADLAIRRTPSGGITLRSGRRVVWRARGLYRNDAAASAFGPHAFAFGVYRRGVFVTDLRGPERLVVRGRGLYPYAYTASGRLIVTGNGRIVVVRPDGTRERRYVFRTRHGFAFDESRDSLYFVRPDGRLVVVPDGRPGRVLRRVDRSAGWLSLREPGLLLLEGRRALLLLRRDGRELARLRWPLPSPFAVDTLSVAPDGGAVAFRLSDARPGNASGTAAVFLLRVGESHPVALLRRRLGPVGCGSGATLSWHRRHLLYRSSDGDLVLVDTRTASVRDLARFARSLPRSPGTGQPLAAWRSEYDRRA